jgi:hypothetical protein
VTSLLVACSNTRSINSNIDQSEFPWSIQVLKWEIAQDLKGSQSIQQYNGDVTQLQFNDKPAEGKSFLLLELIVEKQISGSSTFYWQDLTIIDADGNSYSRMENDTFLQNYNFPRLKSTDLTLGTNKGFIAFEIPTEVVKNGLKLVYSSPDMNLELPLSK